MRNALNFTSFDMGTFPNLFNWFVTFRRFLWASDFHGYFLINDLHKVLFNSFILLFFNVKFIYFLRKDFIFMLCIGFHTSYKFFFS